MGRFAHELAYVMPDEKTVYLTDDGTNVGLFMFVADVAQDLSAGTLYAAKWNQVADTAKGGEANLTWISLGHSDNASVRSLLDPDNNITTADGVVFTDVFASETPVSAGVCPTPGFTYINTANGEECLNLKDVNGDTVVDAADEALAARLETRRMAAMKGATTEFRKEEGVTFNARDNKLYIAMSQVRKGMSDTIGDIQLTENYCGAVYESDIQCSVLDTNSAAIDSSYVAVNMNGIVAGTPIAADANGNTCALDGISEPDNVAFVEGTNTLLIGEDTGNHINDTVWTYEIATGALTRVATTPYGSETTSPYWYNINNNGYITLTTQHPFGEVSGTYVRPAGVDIRSEIGYIGPFDTSSMK